MLLGLLGCGPGPQGAGSGGPVRRPVSQAPRNLPTMAKAPPPVAPAVVPSGAEEQDAPEVVGLTGRRVGQPVPVPAVIKPGERGCTHRVRLPRVWFLTEAALAELGFSGVSPLQPRAGGKALQHVGTDSAVKPCSGTCGIWRGGLLCTTSKAGQGLEVGLSSQAPHRGAWWVYPGTTLTLDLPEGSEVFVRAHYLFDQPPGKVVAIKSATRLPLQVQQRVVTARGPAGPTLAITSPPEGAYVLLDRVEVDGTNLLAR